MARTARRVPPSASLATDHSGRAGALRTARARSGLKCMCPRRQRVSPSVAPLAGFRVPALCAACAVARHTAARVLGDSRAGHGPAHRAGRERAYSAGRSLRAALPARGWLCPLTKARRSRPGALAKARAARDESSVWCGVRATAEDRGRRKRRRGSAFGDCNEC